MSQGSRKGKDGAGRHLTRTAIVNSPELTIPIRHKNGTSYDGTAVINIYLYKRGDRYYMQDARTGKQQALGTTCSVFFCHRTLSGTGVVAL